MIIDYGVSKKDLNEKEKYWIAYYDSYKTGYNSTTGGEINPMNFDEIRKKISLKLMGKKRKFTKELRKKYAKNILKNGKQFKNGKDHMFSKTVYQLNLNDFSIINMFDSILEAENKIIGKKTGAINHAIKNKQISYGYYWVTKEVYEIYKDNMPEYFLKENPWAKKVVQLSKNNKLIKFWNSINEAEEAINGRITGNISKCLSGKTKTAFSYKWIYKDIWDKEFGLEAILNSVITI